MASRKPASAIVIGAGHNGLTCAGLLARRGVQVTILEALNAPGGMAGTQRFAEGYRVPHAAHLLYAPDARVVRDLDLRQHGFEGLAPLHTISLAPGAAPVHVVGSQVQVGEDVTAEQMDEYRRFVRLIERFAAALVTIGRHAPPRLGAPGLSHQAELLRTAWAVRPLDRATIRELLRLGASNVHDGLAGYVSHPRLQGLLGLDGTLGAALGPRSNNSLLNLIHRYGGRAMARAGRTAVPVAAGPSAALHAYVSALVMAVREAGAQIRTGVRVARLLGDGDRVRGVTLEGGDTLTADVVISSLDPATTLLSLADVDWLEADFVHRLERMRGEGRVAKLHLGLSRMPAWEGLEAARLDTLAAAAQVRLVIAPSLDAVERAFDASKYGELPERPVMEVVLPSLHDSSLCASGHHVLSANVQHVPHAPTMGVEQARELLLQRCMRQLEELAPELGSCVEASQVLLPQDLTDRFGCAHWHHVELAMDQFAMLRPASGVARYATPLPGLYLCGAGTHPGGGVSGACAWNAARAVLRGGADATAERQGAMGA